MSVARYFCSILAKSGFLQHIFIEVPNIKIHKIRSIVRRAVKCGHTENKQKGRRMTDRRDEVAAESNVYYILWVCVCSFRYPACNAHEPYCRLLPVRPYNISPNYLLHGKIFGKTKLLKVKCVLISSKRLSEIVLILRIIQREIVNVRRSSC